MKKIFAHRGYHTGNIAENSLKSLDEAVLHGFHGIEIDIHYTEGKLIISHDIPEPDDLEYLPKFHQFLKYKDKMLYWLDFKNLQTLKQDELEDAVKMVSEAIKASDCNLDQFYFAPYVTNLAAAKPIYDKIREVFSEKVKIMAVCDEIEPEKYQEFQQNLLNHNIKFLSIKYDLINQDLIESLSGIELFAWTVNDLALMLNLSGKLGVKNFASDTVVPKKMSIK